MKAIDPAANGPKRVIPHLIPTGLRRRALGYCLNCGRGRLFRAYLKVHPTCERCGHDSGRYPAAGAPTYLTILILGHLVIGPLVVFPFIWTWPTGLVLAILLPALIVLTLTPLPIVKGAVVGVLWALGTPHAPKGTAP